MWPLNVTGLAKFHRAFHLLLCKIYNIINYYKPATYIAAIQSSFSNRLLSEKFQPLTDKTRIRRLTPLTKLWITAHCRSESCSKARSISKTNKSIITFCVHLTISRNAPRIQGANRPLQALSPCGCMVNCDRKSRSRNKHVKLQDLRSWPHSP